MSADQARAREGMMRGAATGLAEMFANLSYEVMPFKGTAESVVSHVPKTTRLTVTASPARGSEATLALAEQLARDGYPVTPHLSARMIADESALREIVDRLCGAGIASVFVIGGDGEPTGKFSDALSLLQALDAIGHEFSEVGVAGYPEGHPEISDDALWQALADKARYANHIVTQICFDARTTISWAHEVRRRGVELPIVIGLPGAVTRQKLIRISARIGLGDSARFLQKQHGMIWRFLLPGGYNPDRLIKRLRPRLGSADAVAGFHIFTFNDLERTEAWRQKTQQRLGQRTDPAERK